MPPQWRTIVFWTSLSDDSGGSLTGKRAHFGTDLRLDYTLTPRQQKSSISRGPPGLSALPRALFEAPFCRTFRTDELSRCCLFPAIGGLASDSCECGITFVASDLPTISRLPLANRRRFA